MSVQALAQPSLPRPGVRERWLLVAAIVGVPTLLTVIDASRSYVSSALFGRPQSWQGALATSAPSWMLVAILAPLPLVLAWRLPVGRIGWGRALSLHLVAACGFAVAHIVAMTIYLDATSTNPMPLSLLLSKLSSTLVVNMLTYAAIAGAAHARRSSQEARARELAASQLEASLTQARLAVLRGQLNPHFLFNTLNAISTMAMKGEQENVVRTIGYLGELLRVSLDDSLPQEVPLVEELEFLDRYLDIQRTRLGDRLTIRHDIDPEVLDAMVPSMFLQPFVENAVTHGIARMPGAGEICVRAARDGSTLLIDVADTGPGVDQHGRSRAGTRGESPGIGLANTRARFAQLYGNAHTITLGSAGARGARVSVTMPYRPAPDSDGELTL